MTKRLSVTPEATSRFPETGGVPGAEPPAEGVSRDRSAAAREGLPLSEPRHFGREVS